MNTDSSPLPEHSCPLCGADNACQPASCGTFDTDCWCRHVSIDAAAMQRLAGLQRETACLCRACATGEAKP